MSVKGFIVGCIGLASRCKKHFKYWCNKHFLKNPKSRKRFRENVPNLSEPQTRILNTIRETGFATIGFEELFGDSNSELQKSLEKMRDDFLDSQRMSQAMEKRMGGERSKDGKSYRITLNPKNPVLNVEDPLLAFGLSPEILDIANSYLQLYSRIVYADVWHSFKIPNATKREASQNWHRDWEDDPLLKVFLFLSDIDETAGPFEYITQSRPSERHAALFPASNLLPGLHNYPDADLIERKVPAEDIVRGCGPAWTIVFCDTSGFHRGGFSTEKSRTMGFYTYISPASNCPRYFRLPDNLDLRTLSVSEQSALI